MTVSLDERVILVTGTSTGIGYALAHVLTERGARVIGMARRSELGAELERELTGAGREFKFVQGDIGVTEDAERAVRTAVDTYGRLDVLINNAAKGTPLRRMEDYTDEDWDSFLAVTLTGTFHMCRAAVPVMREQGSGLIISVSSTGGAEGGACEHFSAYGAAKAGVHQLMRVIAIENLDRDVHTATAVMGGVDTPMAAEAIEDVTRLQGAADLIEQAKAAAARVFMRPEHVARSIAVLCSEDNMEINGATIPIDRCWSTGYGVSLIFASAGSAGVATATP
jgi:meso-butanediol dehydrogenase / (S,S)-butanediol dehydrogenase / diacetyl reductase